jgi:hypothetical protein
MGAVELLPPGIVYTPQWRPEEEQPGIANPADAEIYAAVARIP